MTREKQYWINEFFITFCVYSRLTNFLIVWPKWLISTKKNQWHVPLETKRIDFFVKHIQFIMKYQGRNYFSEIFFCKSSVEINMLQSHLPSTYQ